MFGSLSANLDFDTKFNGNAWIPEEDLYHKKKLPHPPLLRSVSCCIFLYLLFPHFVWKQIKKNAETVGTTHIDI